MTPSTPLSKFSFASTLLPHLCSTFRPIDRLVALSGGSCNYVFRGTLPSSADTVIVKHSAGYVVSLPELAIDTNRSVFESEILTFLAASPLHKWDSTRGVTVTTPVLIHHDRENHILVLSDAGTKTQDLKSLLSTDARSLAILPRDLGLALGKWIKAFHDSFAPHLTHFQGHTSARQLWPWVYYGRLVSTISTFPEELEPHRALFEEVSEKAVLGWKDEAVVHGDFWTGNVLMRSGGKDVMVVDWEMVRAGPRWNDCAQMLAELVLLVWFRGIEEAREVARGFLEAYKGTEEDERRMAVHLAVHTIVIGSSVDGWGEKQAVAKWGARVLERVWREKSGVREVVGWERGYLDNFKDAQT